jgi:hypothetical protein
MKEKKMTKIHVFLAVLALAATGVVWGAAAALADSPGSDAAHACIQGPQRDYYEVLGGGDSAPPLNYHGLAHGVDDSGQYILAGTHGDCVSFAADNTEPSQSISINYTKIVFDNKGQ